MLGAVVVSAQTLDPIIKEMSAKYNVPEALIKAVITVESNWDVNASRYEVGMKDASWGLMQVLLSTARDILNRSNLTTTELLNPKINIEAGTAYLAKQLKRYGGNIADAIAAYNAGTASFNPITRMYSNQSYVNKVYGNYIVYKTKEAFTSTSGIPIILAVGMIGLVAMSGNEK
jgi:soluble lytic murein transglycosylase-like protein